ncbi:DNA cytosine methyltransferase [Acinetobacter baumannii]|uniref:DNA cytosine methyltransferase n=1 Tax=Acinetobacter baumannii TaxID=470 RepID=UPI001EC9B788|nr:DNA cytosine methyltransferase [Acinetobacter baumannii]EKX0522284.1 DNA cytosine methyltransferase [Acinetobacter baumannii]EKX0525813.1 DNA cytosine methyltransferase [Acinetobacter baumannii]EKX0535540.1 DNA cytosine methyltransferase [Acinetobacter baumannii]EKX0539432.1 DNA cytosine methyltransferase [Acinetobacter baumannii]EKY1463165.1 DNA cytosine methyltransferase [Acinetobacter baumannii]
MNELALFAGAGGGILGSHLLGWNTVCAVERDAYASQVLAQRQNDGILKPFPIWSDITTFDGTPWKGIVDVISGGFPCQDISSAGKGAGIDGERSGLWTEMARIIGEVRPKFVFVENSPLLISRGLTRVISDLAKMGYDTQWARVSASNIGAPHQRDRIWIVAHTQSIRLNSQGLSVGKEQKKSLSGINCENVGDSQSTRWEQTGECECRSEERIGGASKELSNTSSIRLPRSRKSWFACDPAENPEGKTDRTFYECVGHIWGIESRLGRVANGVANRVDRLKAVGNGQVPEVARSAFKIVGGAA